MIRDVADRTVMGRYVTAVRRELEAGAVDDDAAKAARTIRPDADAETGRRDPRPPARRRRRPDEDGPFLAHDPIVSLMQTSIDERLREDTVVEQEDPEGDGFFERFLDRAHDLLHPERYGPDDPQWITRIARATLKRLADGNHPFNPEPADHAIADDARLVVVGDWGTGLQRAQHVARHMADAIARGDREGREAHVVHLGDVYYSGVPRSTTATSSPTVVARHRGAVEQVYVVGAQRQPRHVLRRLGLLRPPPRRRALRPAARRMAPRASSA